MNPNDNDFLYDPSLNATYVQVYANNQVVSTPCNLNTSVTPPLASDLSPVDERHFDGPQTDSYIVQNGTIYRTYKLFGTVNVIEEG